MSTMAIRGAAVQSSVGGVCGALEKCALIGLLGWAAASAVAAEPSFTDRIEMLDWSDPERAARKSSISPSLAKGRASEVQFLEIRGMVLRRCPPGRRRRCDDRAAQGDGRRRRSVGSPGRALRAGLFALRARSNTVSRERSSSGTSTWRPSARMPRPTESPFCAAIRLRTLGQAENALPFLEEALDLARDMHDDQRSLHALLWLALIYTNTGNLDRASEQLGERAALGDRAQRRSGAHRSGGARLGYRGPARAIAPPSGAPASRRSSTPSSRTAPSGSRTRSSISATRT